MGASLVSLLATSACYAYVPVDRASPVATGRMRIALTPEGSQALTTKLGPGATVVEGYVPHVRPDGDIDIAVEYVQFQNGMRSPWIGEGTIAIPAAYRERVDRHTYQRRQSLVAGSALAAAVVAAAVIALRAGGADGGGDAGPPAPPALIPRR